MIRKRLPRLRSILFLIIFLGGTLGSSSKADEIVTFFPTFGAPSPDNKSWNVNLHAWVYEPEESSFKRKALLHFLAKKLGLSEDMSETKLFQERARMFLVDNEGGETVSVRLGGQQFKLGPSTSNGHITTTLTVAKTTLDSSAVVTGTGRSIRVDVDPRGERPGFSFDIPLIEPEGLSVISDLDDTIKVSEVGDKRALVMNTFCQDFRAIPGMAKLYAKWSEQGATFHYVSASPWQLQQLIGSFLESSGFPAGTLTLKTFRWKDGSFFDLFAKSDVIKKPFIENILNAFPKRKFILVGDSGELDPELYASVARSHATQVTKIFIRNSTGESIISPRWDRVFEGLPAESWRVFTEPGELEDVATTASEK